MLPIRLAGLLLTVGLLAACARTPVGSATAGRVPDDRAALVARGHYLVRIMDCTGCHTPGSLVGKPDASRELAGSDVGFGFPGGVVYPPNLTSDPETGLGRWTDAQIAAAVRQGVGRDGRALVAYLRTVPPVRSVVPRRVGPSGTPTAPYLTVVTPR